MKLNLKKSIIAFNLKTTGLDLVKSRIVQISYIKVFPDGKEEHENILVNPEKNIPLKVSVLAGIINEDVADAPKSQDIAQKLAEEFRGCDFAGYNSSHFDIPILAREFLHTGINFDFSKSNSVDAQAIFHKIERRSLAAVYKFYCGWRMEDNFEAHRADQDAEVAYRVLVGRLDKYNPETTEEADRALPNDTKCLAEFSKMNDNVDFAGRIVWRDMKGADGKVLTTEDDLPMRQEVFNFGKYKGCVVTEVLLKDPGYYSWMLSNDLTNNTKQALIRICLREFSKK